MRLDQWLWAVRVFKTRSLSGEAIKGGHVKLNGAAMKPAHEVRVDEVFTVRIGVVTRTLRAIGAPPSRVAGKLVPQFMEDLTPPEEYEKQRALMFGAPAVRPAGSGRPTKRERRELDEWNG